MKRSILFALLALILLRVTASPAPQQAVKARIEGIVVRSGSGEPVRGAKLTLTRAGRGNVPALPALSQGATPLPAPVSAGARATAAPPAAIPPAMTDDQGKFVFPDLDEGSYTLQILGNGYVALNYGQRFAGGPGTPIALTSGQELKNLAVNLTPASNVSGRITDRSDQPLANVPVQLMRYSYDAQGQRSYQAVGSAKTNDRGEYRIYWITPGRYYLMAGNPASGGSPLLAMIMMVEGGGVNTNEVPEAFGYSFYPGVSDVSAARPLDLQPGADLDSVNLTLSPKPPSYRVRGRIIDSRTGQPPARARVTALSRTPGIGSSALLDQLGLELPINNYNSDSGAFEIRDLLSGSYLVMAVVQDAAAVAAAASGRGGTPPGISTGTTMVAVADADVEGVTITAVSAVPLSGRIRVDGQQQLPLTPDRLRLQLIARNSGASSLTSLIGAQANSTATPATDSTFRFAAVTVGDYRVAVQSQGGAVAAGARPGSNLIYIKEARFDGTDVLNAPLRILGTAPGALDIVLGVGGGQVTGIVSDRRSQPVPVTQVVLVPDRLRDRTDLYRTVTTDGNGMFTLNGIIPGDYKVFSWESVEPFGWFDPDVMAQSASYGQAVHVTETSTEMIEVKFILKDGVQ